MKTLFRILTITMVLGLLTVGQAGAVSIDFGGDYEFSSNDNDAFQEVLTFSADEFLTTIFPWQSGSAGTVTEQDPDSDTVFSDLPPEFIFVSQLKLNENSYTSGVQYDFIDDNYVFDVYDTDGSQLFYGDLEVSAIELDGGAASINPSFAANLTNIQAGAGYVAGSSEIVDQFLTYPNDGKVQFTFQLGSLVDAVAAIESGIGDGVDGTYSGKASATPEPATMLLLGSGLIGLAGLRRKRFLKK